MGIKLARARKFLVAVLATAAIAAQAAVTDGVITRDEWVKIAVAAVGSALVYQIRNAPPPQVAPTLFARPPIKDAEPPPRPRE